MVLIKTVDVKYYVVTEITRLCVNSKLHMIFNLFFLISLVVIFVYNIFSHYIIYSLRRFWGLKMFWHWYNLDFNLFFFKPRGKLLSFFIYLLACLFFPPLNRYWYLFLLLMVWYFLWFVFVGCLVFFFNLLSPQEG